MAVNSSIDFDRDCSSFDTGTDERGNGFVERSTSLSVLVLIVSFLGIRDIHYWDALSPSNVVQILPILRGIGVTWYLFVQSEVMIYLAAQVRNTTVRQVRRLAGWAVLLQGFWLILFYDIVMGTIGPEATRALRWPIVYVFSTVIIRSLFLSGIGTFILLTWTVSLILYLAVHNFCWSWNLEIMLDTGNKTRMVLVGVLALVLIVGSAWIPSPVSASSIVVGVINPADILFSAVVLLPSFGLSWLRFRRRSQVPIRN